MGVVGSNILAGSSGAAEDYTIDQSLRFNDGDSAKLERELASGDTTAWTFSCWVKRGNFAGSGNSMKIFGAYGDSSNISDINFNEEYIDVSEYVGGSTVGRLKTNALYRDTASWYQITVVWDSDNVTSGDRYRLYVNGDRVTSFSTETQPSSAQASCTNSNADHRFGQQNSDEYFDGYLAEVYFIDGQALDASSFGETDTDTNQWKPIDAKDDLTFGTNGFYQKYSSTELAASFADSSAFPVLTFTPTESITVDAILVAGGGGGGSQYHGGGGGGGGVIIQSGYSATAQSYGIVVGNGAEAVTSATFGRDGENSTGLGMTAFGGGGGGHGQPGTGGRSGGSGGGGGASNGASGATTQTSNGGGTGHGFAGGAQVSSYGAAGGGGAGAVGLGNGGQGGSGSAGGVGGIGVVNNYQTGVNQTYGGGGGGASYSVTPSYIAPGGVGGGGAGEQYNTGNAVSGTDGFGGGGGGNGGYNTTTGTSGGSGIVIIRYASTTAKASGGTITSYVDSGTTYQVHTFVAGHSAHTITANGDVTNTRAQSKVGDSSIYFPAGSDYLSMLDSADWDVGTGDFTIEAWTNFTNSGADDNYDNIFKQDGAFQFARRQSTNQLYMYSGTNIGSSSVDTLADGTWRHVAVCRDSGTVYGYINGVSVFNYSDSTDLDYSSAVTVGSSDGTATWYIDELRFSDTARYPSGTTFTSFGQDGGTIASPTPFTADSNTMLLIHSDFDGGLGADSSGNAHDFDISNISATDVCLDSPSNTFATLNPLDGNGAYSEGNLKVVTPA